MGGVVLPVVINKYVLSNFIMLGTNKYYTHGFVKQQQCTIKIPCHTPSLVIKNEPLCCGTNNMIL